MKIKKLLEYQDVDKELQKLNRDLNNSNEAKAIAQSKQQVAEAKDALLKLDRMAGELIANFEKNQAVLIKNQAASKEFKKAIKDVNDIKEIDYVQKKLEELIYESNNLNKEIIQIKDRIQQIKVKTNEAMRLGKDSSEKYREAKAVYDKLKDEMNPKVKNVTDRLAVLEKEISDSQLMDIYMRLRNNKIFPALVRCENTSCMGCGMNIANDIQIKLKSSNEVVDCPNCGRILYLSE